MKSMARKLLEHLNKVNEESLPRLDGFVATVAGEVSQGNIKGETGQKAVKFFTEIERELTLKLLRSVDNSLDGEVVGIAFLYNGDFESALNNDVLNKREVRIIKSNPETMSLLRELGDSFDEFMYQ